MSKLPIPFGNPNTYPGHSGVDFPQAQGTLVPASGSGVVSGRGYGNRSGYYSEVRYDNGPEVFSCHFPSLHSVPAVGTRVSIGDTIGIVGSTGNSTGPHLHQEITGAATTAGYWQYMDGTRVVGGGSAGGNTTDRGVIQIQQKLKDSGFYTGEVDGIWGPLTEAAVKSLQRAKGIEVDGIYGPASDAMLFGGRSTPTPSGSSDSTSGVHGPNPFGIPFTGGLQKIARLYGYTGALDQNFGAGSMGGFAQFLRANWGYDGNDELGPVMWKAIQRWLKSRWGYTGEIDGIPGPLTREALNRADGENWLAL